MTESVSVTEQADPWCVCGSPSKDHVPHCVLPHCSCLGYREARSSKQRRGVTGEGIMIPRFTVVLVAALVAFLFFGGLLWGAIALGEMVTGR